MKAELILINQFISPAFGFRKEHAACFEYNKPRSSFEKRAKSHQANDVTSSLYPSHAVNFHISVSMLFAQSTRISKAGKLYKFEYNTSLP